MRIRPAIKTDAYSIVKLIQQSFDPIKLNAMIYGCHGIERYVKYCISAPGRLSDTLYMVSEHDGRIIACIELKFIEKTIFLNYICILPNMRNEGIGKKLLRQGIRTIGTSFYDTMRLDVFHDNVVAATWYKSLGFIPEYTTNWVNISLPYRKYVNAGKIGSIAAANVCQREFGFSQFSLNTETASYLVGRLNNDWFRINQENLLADDSALETLRRFDSKRRILALFNESANFNLFEDFSPFCKSDRMFVKLASLIRALE